MNDFCKQEIRNLFGVETSKLQPYNYERYKKVNPNLTESAYEHLRSCRSEWKILCGLSVSTHWGFEILKELWWLKNNDGYKTTEFYKYRYVPENYLKLTTW